ncbi:hypothetical protein V6N13_131908 [Hibiscus sabdariffa]
MWAQRSDRQPMLQQITAEQTAGPYTSAGAGVDTGGPSVEPYTPMPQLFSHASSSQFQPQFTPMPPPTEGFFAGAYTATAEQTVDTPKFYC